MKKCALTLQCFSLSKISLQLVDCKINNIILQKVNAVKPKQ